MTINLMKHINSTPWCKIQRITLSLTLVVLLLTSCTKDKPTNPVISYDKTEGVFICNEGNFTYGNASLSFYNPDTKTTDNSIFYNANSFPLGDVLQSMTLLDSVAFLVLNNSGKVAVINSNTFKHIHTIEGLQSPRYIHIISPEKGLISDLYSNYITVFNPSTFEISGNINIGCSSEQMVQTDNKLFINSWSYNNKIIVLDVESFEILKTVEVSKQPNSLALDHNGNVWVLSDGGFEGSSYVQEIPKLTCINSSTLEIQKEFIFPNIESSPSELCINSGGDTLFFLSGAWAGEATSAYGIFRMAVEATTLPSYPFIAQEEKLFYGLSIDPSSSELYVSDAIDYMQNGWIYRYSTEGEEVDAFKVGIIPNGAAFKL